MLLRLFRGTVAAGRETDFVAICRQEVAGLGRAPGLAAFISGYRRVTGVDQFILAASWDSEEQANNSAGTPDNPVVPKLLEGVASVDSFDTYTVIEPAFRGIVDAPGGVVRVATVTISKASREQLLAWLHDPRRSRGQNIEHVMLGWSIGERPVSEDSLEVVAVSAWPSPLVIEAIADQRRPDAPMYAEVEGFVSDFHVESYRAIGLDLPEEMADVGARRIVAARFASQDAADRTARALSATLAGSGDDHVSVAPLGEPGVAASDRSYVLVARVAIDEYARAERLIADHDGEVILAQRETILTPQAEETESFALNSPALAPAPGLSVAK